MISQFLGDYNTFRDATGEFRVEIEPRIWKGREATPETMVRIVAEVDRGMAGRYLWVKSREIES